MRPFDPIAVLEAAYRPVDGPTAWLSGVMEALEGPLDYGLGLAAYRVDVGVFELKDLLSTQPELTDRWRASVLLGIDTPARRGAVMAVDPYGIYSNSEVFKSIPLERVNGEADCYTVAFHDGESDLYAICALLPNLASVPQEVRPIWRRIAIHLSAASRLARRPVTLDDTDVEAVLSPSGQILSATPHAQGADEQTALRDFARRVDRARSSAGRKDPDEALDLWTGLILGRWSLVDHFDTDGRRFIVARKNDPNCSVPGALTRRERQVAFYTGLGLGHKQVGYALGLSESAIGTHVGHVLKKLGLDSREQLIALAMKSIASA